MMLYYTKITIGTPPVDYHVQIDTGSDIIWVNCKNCKTCPTKIELHIVLNQYDLTASSIGKTITCDQDFCDTVFNNPSRNCKAGMNCEYAVTYGDGSKTEGYFVREGAGRSAGALAAVTTVIGAICEAHSYAMVGGELGRCRDKQIN